MKDELTRTIEEELYLMKYGKPKSDVPSITIEVETEIPKGRRVCMRCGGKI